MTGTEAELTRRVAALGRTGHRAVVAGTIRGRRRAVGGWSADGAAPDGLGQQLLVGHAGAGGERVAEQSDRQTGVATPRAGGTARTLSGDQAVVVGVADRRPGVLAAQAQRVAQFPSAHRPGGVGQPAAVGGQLQQRRLTVTPERPQIGHVGRQRVAELHLAAQDHGALTLAQQPQARLAARIQVGLCWLILSTPAGGRVVWHNSGTWGFRSFAGFAPDQSSAAVVLSNTARSVDRIGLDLTQDRVSDDAKPVS